VPTEWSLVSTSCVLVVYQRNPPRDRGRSTTGPQPPRTGFVGTDFRHAVEFSRSGRAPVLGLSAVLGATC